MVGRRMKSNYKWIITAQYVPHRGYLIYTIEHPSVFFKINIKRNSSIYFLILLCSGFYKAKNKGLVLLDHMTNHNYNKKPWLSYKTPLGKSSDYLRNSVKKSSKLCQFSHQEQSNGSPKHQTEINLCMYDSNMDGRQSSAATKQASNS